MRKDTSPILLINKFLKVKEIGVNDVLGEKVLLGIL